MIHPTKIKNSLSGKRTTLYREEKAFTLIEVMIVVIIIGILLAIAVPNFVYTRETTRKKACMENLWKLQFAKEYYMMDSNLPGNSPASTFTDAVLYGSSGSSGYLQTKPSCPGGGNYSINDGDVLPTCDYEGGNVHNIGNPSP
jgi:prepilin-type N-terminal cleavage/methylation domain-containing protein